MESIRKRSGFTLAELLIVIAIIAALVAIMIPTFSGQVEKAREAADIANIRAACSEVAFSHLDEGVTIERKVPVTQTKKKWQSANNEGVVELDNFTIAGSVEVASDPVGAGHSYHIYWSESTDTIKVDIIDE